MSGKGNAANSSTKTVQADKLSPGNKTNNDVGVPDVPSDDEVVTWLQYPLDDTFEKSYCSDLFGQWGPSSIVKTPSITGDIATARLSGNVGTVTGMGKAGTEEHSGSGPLLRSTSADAALALGAERAAGLIQQAGLEAFGKVRTTMQPPPGSQSSARHSSSQKLSEKSEPSTPSSSMLYLSLQNASSIVNKLPLQPSQGGLRSNSTWPVAGLRAEVCPASPQSNALLSKHDQGKVQSSGKSKTSGSIISKSSYTVNSDCSRKGSDARFQISSVQQSGCSQITEEATARRSTSYSYSVGRKGESFTAQVSANTSERLAPASVECQRTEFRDIVFPSCSGGSQVSVDVSMKEASSGKRKAEESECQSEEAEGESAETKQPRKSSKRNRAAEVHNLSERRRRNRINEKMKTLQELIPNSNKTDKASMLDEAIEYMKTLQLQLQMVSMRNGMSVSPMMLPAGMPHMQMAQMAPLPSMGVPISHAGIGMGMGMGVGIMDLSHGVTGTPLHSLPATGPHFSIPFQAATANGYQNCSQPSSNMEFPPSDFLAYQHSSSQTSEQVHMNPHNVSYVQMHQQQDQPQQPILPRQSTPGTSESYYEQLDNDEVKVL